MSKRIKLIDEEEKKKEFFQLIRQKSYLLHDVIIRVILPFYLLDTYKHKKNEKEKFLYSFYGIFEDDINRVIYPIFSTVLWNINSKNPVCGSKTEILKIVNPESPVLDLTFKTPTTFSNLKRLYIYRKINEFLQKLSKKYIDTSKLINLKLISYMDRFNIENYNFQKVENLELYNCVSSIGAFDIKKIKKLNLTDVDISNIFDLSQGGDLIIDKLMLHKVENLHEFFNKFNFNSLKKLFLHKIDEIKTTVREFPKLKIVIFSIIDKQYFYQFFSKILNKENIVAIKILNIKNFDLKFWTKNVIFPNLKMLHIGSSQNVVNNFLEQGFFPILERIYLININEPIKNLRGDNELKYIIFDNILRLTDDFFQNLSIKHNYYKNISIGNNNNLTGTDWSISNYESLNIEYLKLVNLNNFRDDFLLQYKGTIDNIYLEQIPNLYGFEVRKWIKNLKHIYFKNLQNFEFKLDLHKIESLTLIDLPKLQAFTANKKTINLLHLQKLPLIIKIDFQLDNLVILTIDNLPNLQNLNFEFEHQYLEELKLSNLPLLKDDFFMNHTFMKLEVLHLINLPSFKFENWLPIPLDDIKKKKFDREINRKIKTVIKEVFLY
jgi:hypothetical protein